MGQRTLRDIIEADDRLRKFNLIKNTKYDKSTWKFQIVDERSPYGGYEEFLMRKFKAEQEFKKSKEYKILVAVSVIGFIIAVILPIIILIR